MVSPVDPHTEEVTPIKLLLLGADWRPVAELQLVKFKGKTAINDPSDAEATVYIGGGAGKSLDQYVKPWATVVLTVENKPIWGGFISKRIRTVGQAQVRLALREWPKWLDRAWSAGVQFEYAPPAGGGMDDASDVVWDRMQKATSMTAGRPYMITPPLTLGPKPPPVGLPVDVDFPSQKDEHSPLTYFKEIQQIIDLGLDVRMAWTILPDGRHVPCLHTSKYSVLDPPTATINAGMDSVTVEVGWDSEPQMNFLKLVAAHGLEAMALSNDMDGEPALMSVRSYEQLGKWDTTDAAAQSKADALADSIMYQNKDPVLLAEQVKLVGIRSDIQPGQMIELVVERDADNQVGAGMSFIARVQSIDYVVGEGGERSTTLALAAPTDKSFNPTPNARQPSARPATLLSPPPARLPPNDPVAYMRELERRITSLEARRSATTRPSGP